MKLGVNCETEVGDHCQVVWWVGEVLLLDIRAEDGGCVGQKF